MKKHRLAAVTAIVVVSLLSGCGANKPMPYKERQSEAWNITRAAGFTRLEDARLPEGVSDPNAYEATDLFWDAGYISSPFWSAVTTGFTAPEEVVLNALAVLMRVSSTTKDGRKGMFAWMPSDLAENEEDARRVMGDLLTKASLAAFAEVGATSATSTPPAHALQSFSWSGGNCTPVHAPCYLNVQADAPEKTVSPAMLGGYPALFFSTDTLWAFPHTASATKDENGHEFSPSAEWVAAFSKALPEWVFVYAPPKYIYIDKENKQANQTPVVFSQGRVKFFVKPSKG